MRLTFLTALLFASFSTLHAAELLFAGTLGNSDDSQPVFAGKLAAGIGPVLDDEGTLWERGGSFTSPAITHPVFLDIPFSSTRAGSAKTGQRKRDGSN
jgi:hypothetical protein